MKKIKLFVFTLLAMFVAVVGVNADDSTLPNESDGKITLTGDVTLNSTYEVPVDKTLTIDLNGHNLTINQTTGYSINNKGSLTITNSQTDGKLTVNTRPGSGIINNGPLLNVENVHILGGGGSYSVVKNQVDEQAGVSSTLNVKNSRVEGNFNYGIQAGGTVNIENVTFSFARRADIVIIPAASSNSNVTINNITSVKPSRIEIGDSSLFPTLTGGEATLNIEGINGTVDIYSYDDSTIVGDVKATETALSHAKNGSKIIIPEDYVAENITVAEGVEVVLATGTDPYKEVVENEDGTYTIEYKDADYTALEKAIADAQEVDKTKYTEETVKALEDALTAAKAVSKTLKANEQATIDNATTTLNNAIKALAEIVVNEPAPEEPAPDTYDGGLSLVGLAVLGLGASIFTVRKLRNN